MANFTLNGQVVEVSDELRNVHLLWFLREHKELTGTKYGCGMTECGACTVLIDGVASTSCQTPMARVLNKTVTTIEGLAAGDGTLHPVQAAWIEHGVAQCGYCQSGQVLAAVSFLSGMPNLLQGRSEEEIDREIDSAMSANLCRCGTYVSMRKAIRLAARTLAEQAGGRP